MSTVRTFVLRSKEIRLRAASWIVEHAPADFIVRIVEPARNLEQNALMWVWLDAFSKQLKWPVNGAMVSMAPDDWKDVLTAAFHGETVRLAMGLNGGVVMLGLRTSKFSMRKMAEFITFLQATAVDRGVTLDEDEVDHGVRQWKAAA